MVIRIYLITIILLLPILLLEAVSNNNNNLQIDLRVPLDPGIAEDAKLKVPQLIEKYGYKCEIHHVVTLDGYILEMHRIPANKPQAPIVFLMHGLLDSSSTWIMMGPNKGFGYMLADLGYDVWMGNARGNRYSRQHQILKPENSNFWQFSFHEIGKFDLPAMIDYSLKENGNTKLHYIGHSQGTTSFWVFLNENENYHNKIHSMQALAPVAYLKYNQSPLVNVLTYFWDKVGMIINWIGQNEFMPQSDFLALISKIFCRDGQFTQGICAHIIFQITGYNEQQMNKTMLPVMIGHTPAGASTKQVIHYSQMQQSGIFRQYDYGLIMNKYHYGTFKPPQYDLAKVKAKVALYYSLNDWLGDVRDVEKLHQELGNPIGKYLVQDRKFNHLDFVWGIDARPYLYERVVKIIDLVEKGEI